MTILLQLEDEIKDQMEYLHKLEVGTNEYEKAVKGIATLMDKRNDILKAQFEQKEQVAKREADQDIKRSELEQAIKKQKDDRNIEWAKLAAGVTTTVGGLLVILKWEETGNITTALRGYVNNFIPKKIF